MKNKKIWLGILAMTLVFAMTVVSCSDDNGEEGPTGGNAGIPGTADGRFSINNQQVWTFDWENNRWAHYQGVDRTGISCWNFDGNGTITNGRLTFTLTAANVAAATPSLMPLEDYFDWIIEEGGTISVEGVRVGSLRLEGSDFDLRREHGNFELVSNGFNFIDEWVDFVYVNRAVTITHPGGRFEYDGDDNGFAWEDNFTVRAFRIDLEQGWNALHEHWTGTVIITDSSETMNATVTMNAGNPARLRWVIYEWGGFGAEGFSAQTEEAFTPERHGGLRRSLMLRGRANSSLVKKCSLLPFAAKGIFLKTSDAVIQA